MISDMSETPESHILRTFEIKLFHEINPHVPCKNQGKSEIRMVTATDKFQARVTVETGIGALFAGDKCMLCGSLAKVSVS